MHPYIERERSMMLDLTGKAVLVPPIGRAPDAPNPAADAIADGPATSVWSRTDLKPQRAVSRTAASAAVATLTSKGYRWFGGEHWKPSLGKRPRWLDREIEHDAAWDAANHVVLAAGRIEI